MNHISYTSIVFDTEPTLSQFITALLKAYHFPKYVIKVSYAFEAIYFTVINRKIYFVHKYDNVYRVGFMHTSLTCANYIPLIQEEMRALYDRGR